MDLPGIGARDFFLGGEEMGCQFCQVCQSAPRGLFGAICLQKRSNMQPDKPDKPDICFPDPGTAIRVFREGQDDGVVRFVRSVRRGLGGDLGFCCSKNRPHMQPDKTDKTDSPQPGPGTSS